MKPSMLVTMPNYDRMTWYLSAWADEYIKTLVPKAMSVYMLRGEDVKRKKFESYVKKQRPTTLFINGHGAADRIAGHDHDIILDTQNVSVLKGINVYALSCQSAKELGPKAIEAGAKGYIGYKEDFILVSQPSKAGHPKDDAAAALFLNPSNVIVAALGKGHNVQESAQKGKSAYTNSILQALNSDIQSDFDKYVPYLIWNRTHLSVHGV